MSATPGPSLRRCLEELSHDNDIPLREILDVLPPEIPASVEEEAAKLIGMGQDALSAFVCGEQTEAAATAQREGLLGLAGVLDAVWGDVA